jgi:hypothetical protein
MGVQHVAQAIVYMAGLSINVLFMTLKATQMRSRARLTWQPSYRARWRSSGRQQRHRPGMARGLAAAGARVVVAARNAKSEAAVNNSAAALAIGVRHERSVRSCSAA